MDPQRLQSETRRAFFSRSGIGLGAIALSALLEQDRPRAAAARPSAAPFGPKPPHFSPRAKAVIHLFMAGGPSHLDLFDYKPKLQGHDGEPIPGSYVEGKRFFSIGKDAKLYGTRRTFRRHGQSGAEISDLLPHTARMADDIAIVRSVVSDQFIHGPAKLLLTTGSPRFGFPSVGSWVTYGIGSESQDLPGFVVLQSGPRGPRGGAALWSNGFLPTVHQGVPLRSSGAPILYLDRPEGVTKKQQQRTIEAIQKLNSVRLTSSDDDTIRARIANYELAYRMQTSAPDLIDISGETPETLRMYGAEPGLPSFANNCLLARRLVERGVRFVMLFHTDWDHHSNLERRLGQVCRETDQASAALVEDLEQRGLLAQTLVVWGGEFGRTPMRQGRGSAGRDHHPDAFSMWFAGGGVQGGRTIGETDELGFYPARPADRIHVHDLQATVLHLLGLDHLELTYRTRGRDFRLTDVGGQVVHRLL